MTTEQAEAIVNIITRMEVVLWVVMSGLAILTGIIIAKELCYGDIVLHRGHPADEGERV